YWVCRRRNWGWDEELPLVLLFSMLAAAYGAWPYDLVLLLVPVMQVAARPRDRRLAVGLHAAINGAALLLIASRVEFFWFVCMTLTLMLAYLVTRRSGFAGGDKQPE